MLAGVLIGWMLLSSWGVPAAAAHASLIAATPADGSHAEPAPRVVTFSLSESATLVADSAAVINRDGVRAELASSRVEDGGRRVVIELSRTPGDGAYLATAQVVSADTHVVSLSTRFTVGSVTELGAAAATPKAGVNPLVVGSVKVIAYLGLILTGGIFLASRWVWPDESGEPRYLRTYRIGMVIFAVGLLGRFVVLAAQQSGGLTQLSPQALLAFAATRVGTATIAALVLGGFAVATAGSIGRWRTPLGYGAAVAGIFAITLAGHGGATQRWPLSLVDTLIHVYAVSVWFGGVVVIAVVLPQPRRIRRWHVVAGGHLLAAVASGSILAMLQVDPAAALFRTDYGILLMAKVGLVIAAAAVGYTFYRRWAGRLVPHGGPSILEEGADTRSSRPRLVVVEAVLAVVVITVTAALSSVVPARDSYTTNVEVALRFERAHVLDVELDTIRRGDQTLTLRRQASATEPAQVDVELSSEQANVARLPVDLVALPGRTGWRSEGLIVPAPGRWKVTVRYDWGVGPRLASFGIDVR